AATFNPLKHISPLSLGGGLSSAKVISLSPWERAEQRERYLPLPLGEGWGEGLSAARRRALPKLLPEGKERDCNGLRLTQPQASTQELLSPHPIALPRRGYV